MSVLLFLRVRSQTLFLPGNLPARQGLLIKIDREIGPFGGALQAMPRKISGGEASQAMLYDLMKSSSFLDRGFHHLVPGHFREDIEGGPVTVNRDFFHQP